jgi:hypothetical protein
MVAEKSGLIRIYNIETMSPAFTLACSNYNDPKSLTTLPLTSIDWSQLNPEIVIGNTSNDLIIFNTMKSW